MNFPKTAHVALYCGLFLLLLFFFSFDLALTVTISLFLFLNTKNYKKLLVVSFILFIIDIVFRNFDISFRFISDLSLSSYILLLTSVSIYAKSSKRITDFFQQAGKSGKFYFSSKTLILLFASSILVLLLLPILGTPFAVVAGYLSFSYFSKQFSGKYAYAAGLFFLLFCPFFIIAKKDSLSENFAIISFYFLIIGTAAETVRLVQERKGGLEGWIKISLKKVRRKEAVKEDVMADRVSIPKSFAFRLPKINFGASQKVRTSMKFIIVAGISVFVGFTVTFYSIRNTFVLNNIRTIITSSSQKITPTIATNPTVTPIIPTPAIDVAAELSSISAQLKVMVENGTEINGLAASTAARLNTAGFINVDTANAARNDYTNWEITSIKDDPALIHYIKRELRLDTLTVHKASESAKFDVVIIAGSLLP